LQILVFAGRFPRSPDDNGWEAAGHERPGNHSLGV
jgi:hypothetical protein